MTAREEQETTITMTRADDVVRVWSCWPAHVAALRKNDRAREVGQSGGGVWFEIPVAEWNPIRGFRARRAPLSEEERERRRESMSALRSRRVSSVPGRDSVASQGGEVSEGGDGSPFSVSRERDGVSP